MFRNIFLISIALIFLFSCNKPAPQTQGGAVPVNIYQVKAEEATYHESYPATIVALNEVEVRSEVSGFLTHIYFKEGEPVKKGQKLYEIERSKYLAAFEQAKANLQVARSNYLKAEKDAERYSKLGEMDAIAKQRVDYAQTDFHNAKQQVTAAEAQLRSAETDLSHSLITAPFDGTIGISLVKLGAFITAGQTQLNTISSDNPIGVDFAVNEKEIYRFIKMMEKSPSKTDSTFTLLMPDKSLYPFSGSISVVDRAVDASTGTIKVRLHFPNPKKELRSGMTCNVRVKNNELNNPLVVPYIAVGEQMGEYFVYSVQNDTARQKKIALGPIVGDKVVVKEGINSGDKIVVDGIQKLREGTPVQVGSPQQTGGPQPTASK